jgi:hypothetical protein
MMLNRQVLMAAVATICLPMILQAADPPTESTTVLSGQQFEQALQHPAMTRGFVPSRGLGKDRFMVADHTDAKGSAQYNKQPSLKRAEAVKEDASNRRVEIRDLGQSAP